MAPHFTVIEEADAQLLQDDILAQLLRDLTAAPESEAGNAFALLVGELGEKTFRKAVRNVLYERDRLGTALARAGGLVGLDAQLRAALGLVPEETEQALLQRAAEDDAAFARADLVHAAEALAQGAKTCQAFGRDLAAWLAAPAEERIDGFDNYLARFFTKDGEERKNYADKKTLAAWPEAEHVLRQEAARLSAVRERLEAARGADLTRALLHIGFELIRRYDVRKTAQAALDYDDLIIHARALSAPSGHAALGLV